MKERDLQDVKVGDIIASLKTVHNSKGRFMEEWTGVLREVTKVAPKRFMVGLRWYDKATGREPGRAGAYAYVLATPEMIAAHETKRRAREAEDAKRHAFHARPDYKDASAIEHLLSEMNPDNHPLDRLTPAEWAALRRRLGALDSGDWSWQCNECGSNEFSSSVSEHDLESLSCTNCGGNEFHKVKA